ncbi:MAG: formylglycine-generating enzyme family protein [Verrucomicrobiota bacterium]
MSDPGKPYLADWEEAGRREDVLVPIPGGLKMAFRWIPKGWFRMGSRERRADEQPVHWVHIEEDFLLGKFPVTQREYAAVAEAMGLEEKAQRPSYFEGDDLPVEQVSWNDAIAFAEFLSKEVELPEVFSLPSEAQWEYACRAGTRSEYWSGDGLAALEEVGWWSGNSGQRTHRVGERGRPNPVGLHDLHGNVFEWCEDYYWDAFYRNRVQTDAKAMTAAHELPAKAGDPFWLEPAKVLRRVAEAEAREGGIHLTPSEVAVLRPLAESFKRIVKEGAKWAEVYLKELMPAVEEGLWMLAPSDAAESAKIFEHQGRPQQDSESRDRVLRGGSWDNAATICRAACRNRYLPDYCDWSFGFRLGVVPVPVQSGDAGGGEQEGAERPKARPAEAGDPPKPDGPTAEETTGLNLENERFRK